MVVYVESNFVIEAALLQGESNDAHELLRLGERGTVELRVPSFALCEPFTTLVRRRAERDALGRSIKVQLQQLQRSPIHAGDVRRLRHVPRVLTDIGAVQADQLEGTVLTLLTIGRQIPLDAQVLRDAINFRDQYGFGSTQDAIVFASVVADLRAAGTPSPRCFITRNSEDFERNPLVKAELKAHGCELKTRFAAGLAYVRSKTLAAP